MICAERDAVGTAYTPGLTVDARVSIRKTRRLPLKGEVLVAVGQSVEPDTAVARTELPGEVILVRAADRLGITGAELPELLRRQVGDAVEEGELIAETPGLLGRFFKSQLLAPVAGTIETVTERTGNLSIRRPPRPVELTAYVEGTVVELLPAEGAVIETRGALVQGIFGVGGERVGTLRAVADPGELPADLTGCVVAVPGRAEVELYRRVAESGAAGLVAGAVLDGDLAAIVGHDIGVAITGEEDIPATLIITEGFGPVAMAERTWSLLSALDGRRASISGATQVRAGVIRPEILVPDLSIPPDEVHEPTAESQILAEGSRIRLIREPHFGALATVTELPSEPRQIATGAKVRVLTARLDDGSEVTVPRANVELIEG